jgi:hypothetical protein
MNGVQTPCLKHGEALLLQYGSKYCGTEGPKFQRMFLRATTPRHRATYDGYVLWPHSHIFSSCVPGSSHSGRVICVWPVDFDQTGLDPFA